MGGQREAARESLPAEWVPMPWACPTEVMDFRMCPLYPVGLGDRGGHAGRTCRLILQEAAAVALKMELLENSPLGAEGVHSGM